MAPPALMFTLCQIHLTSTLHFCGSVAVHAHLLLDWGLQELDAELQAEAAAQPKCRFVAPGMDTAVQALQAEQETHR